MSSKENKKSSKTLGFIMVGTGIVAIIGSIAYFVFIAVKRSKKKDDDIKKKPIDDKKECFLLRYGGRYAITKDNAKVVAQTYGGGELATVTQLETAASEGAQWCSWGWVLDTMTNNIVAALPQQVIRYNSQGVPVCGDTVGVSYSPTEPSRADVIVYGIKPNPEDIKDDEDISILPWFRADDYGTLDVWSKYSETTM
ncbi:MAG: hypothetical protein DRM99_05120 [Thermoplasmata archaeon]|nr:MAG: hypothetical protein DRM99_05120 [Thermoplasmata archaeon]